MLYHATRVLAVPELLQTHGRLSGAEAGTGRLRRRQHPRQAGTGDAGETKSRVRVEAACAVYALTPLFYIAPPQPLHERRAP